MGTGSGRGVAGWVRSLYVGDLLHAAPRPTQWPIGVRLTACFVTIVLLMMASHILTLWQFDRVRKQEERMHELDQESRAVLRVHANLLILRDRLASSWAPGRSRPRPPG